MRRLAKAGKRLRLLVCSGLASCLVVIVVASAAHASQSWGFSIITPDGIKRADSEGTLSFWDDGIRFKALEIDVSDDAGDGYGQNFYFYITDPDHTDFSRTFYWGGGNNTTGQWFNEVITPSIRTQYAQPSMCLVNNGVQWVCNANDALYNPHYPQ